MTEENMSAGEADWQNDPTRLGKKREEASELMQSGNHLGAHSTMLSAYCSVLGATGRWWEKLQAVFLIWGHLYPLLVHLEKLNHNQVNVLLRFLLRVPRYFTEVLLPRSGVQKLAERGCELARRPGVKPHQLALAILASAEVKIKYYGIRTNEMFVRQLAREALALAGDIEREREQPQGMRQLVRIYRQAAEIFVQTGDRIAAENSLFWAYRFAKAKNLADTPDQVEKIKVQAQRLGITLSSD